ncbi:MAG TPA: hypothetical protein ENJ18_15055, partial [Nannocystis exedens]|nr:hypothetical protein [Nannocystis exedens]
MDHEGTSLRSALHLAARRAQLRGVGLSSPSAQPDPGEKNVQVPPPPPVGTERSRLNALVSEALRAQAAVGIREPVEAKSAGVVGGSLATELPPLPILGRLRPSCEQAEHERGERGDVRETNVEQVAAPRPAEVKPTGQTMESAVLAEQVEQAAWVESVEQLSVGERVEEEAELPGDPESAVAASVQEIDIDVDVEIDVEDLGDPRASERRLLYFLRDRFINAPERVEAALRAY